MGPAALIAASWWERGGCHRPSRSPVNDVLLRKEGEGGRVANDFLDLRNRQRFWVIGTSVVCPDSEIGERGMYSDGGFS